MADFGEDSSDDEVFVGKMTLREVKKHIWFNHEPNKTSNIVRRQLDRNSIKIIETHSEPNLRSSPLNSPSPPGSAPDNKKSDESFIKMENLVSKLCLSPEKAAELELNNTLEIVEYILNNGPSKESKKTDITNVNDIKTETSEMEEKEIEIVTKFSDNSLYKSPIKELTENYIKTETPETQEKEIEIVTKFSDNSLYKSLIKELTENDIKTETPETQEKEIKIVTNFSDNSRLNKSPIKELLLAEISMPKTTFKTAVKTSPKYSTPAKSTKKQANVYRTPYSNMLEAKTPTFKTPANPLSLKKTPATSLTNTPSKSKYRHIKSPLAKYIHGSIEVPMVTNVCPKKPLPGGSMIPKLVKKEPQSKQNKENISLPTSAYKNAKKTKVVQTPDEETPKSQVAKKLLSTLPRPPVILKHETREYKSAKKPLVHLQDDTIADQSCLQADVSVCTQVKPSNPY